jgi:hypothetical protein
MDWIDLAQNCGELYRVVIIIVQNTAEGVER